MPLTRIALSCHPPRAAAIRVAVAVAVAIALALALALALAVAVALALTVTLAVAVSLAVAVAASLPTPVADPWARRRPLRGRGVPGQRVCGRRRVRPRHGTLLDGRTCGGRLVMHQRNVRGWRLRAW
jgi:hypothetical protein